MNNKLLMNFIFILCILLPFGLSEGEVIATSFDSLLGPVPITTGSNPSNSCSTSCANGLKKVNSLELMNLDNYSSVIFIRDCNQTYLCVKKKENLTNDQTNVSYYNKDLYENLRNEVNSLKGEIAGLHDQLNKTQQELDKLKQIPTINTNNLPLNDRNFNNENLTFSQKNKSILMLFKSIFKK